MRFLACLICFLQIMWAGRSFAIVDVKNGNFTTSRIDLNYPAIGYNLRVHRTYNSEPIFQGMFGAGWCSDFETKLIVLSESEILVRQCGNGQDKFFSSKAAPQLNATLSQLRDRLTKEFPKEKMKIDGLIESSKTNLPLLATFVDAYKISVKPAKGSVFAIRTGGGELVRFDGKDFLLKWLRGNFFACLWICQRNARHCCRSRRRSLRSFQNRLTASSAAIACRHNRKCERGHHK